MSILIGILLTVFVFLVVVLIHEFGHFSLARLTGMKVLEFGFGIPPKLFRLFRDQKGTDYTVNLLPIGGFVRIKGEDPMSLEALDTDSFSSKKWWARIVVLLAGVSFNFLLSIVILSIFFTVGTAPVAPNFLSDKDYGSLLLPSPKASLLMGYLTSSGVEIAPIAGGIAERSGVLPGDRVVTMNGVRIKYPEQVIAAIKTNIPFTFSVTGTGGERLISMSPQGGRVGMSIGYRNLSINRDFNEQYSLGDSISAAIHETYVLSYMTIDVLGITLKNLILPDTPEDHEIAKSMISGPIGMGSAMVSLVDVGISWKMIWMIIAFISINLGVINLLPFPALDGGRVVSTTIKSLLSYTPLDQRHFSRIENMFNMVGMIFLLSLSLMIAFFDVTKML